MEISVKTSLSKDAKKVLLQLIDNIRVGVAKGFICSPSSLGTAAAHLREFAEYIADPIEELDFAIAEETPEEDKVLCEFLQCIPESWGENPWPEILHPTRTPTIKMESKTA